MRLITWLTAAAMACLLGAAALYLHEPSRSLVSYAAARARGGYTLEERIRKHSEDVAERLAPAFTAAGLAYPPHEVAYLGFKDTRSLEVYARESRGAPWRFVKRYAVLAASGQAGPKLREGDHQVPEGIYRAEYLNPNSRFHLSIRLNYPNAFDRRMAQADGRTRLGGDIMIHGSSVSIGCLAMGDEAAEDLFILSALVSKERTRIVVSPTDFRVPGRAAPADGPAWTRSLYEMLRGELVRYPRAHRSGETH